MKQSSIFEIWKELGNLLETGFYPPIPFRAYPLADMASAFKNMRKGLHIGKNVVSFKGVGVVLSENIGIFSMSSEASYLVTGGLRGFGLAAARWLAGCGARTLVLAGRSGPSSEEAKAALSEFEQQGIQVSVECVDVSKEVQVAELIKRIGKTLPPLKGIVHAAMVLDDAAIVNLNEQKMKKVCDPKILGAWNLHAHTLDKKLDFFICCSSISAAIGNAGQGNYVAANYFLETLAKFRTMHGLPALTVSLGPLSEVGFVSRNVEVKEHLLRFGAGEVSLDLVWKTICLALREKISVVGLYNADWNTMGKYNRRVQNSPRFSKLIRGNAEKDGSGDSDLQTIMSLQPEERKLELSRILAREISRFLGIDFSKISAEEPIAGLGIDSFTVVELIVRIEKILGLRLMQMTFLKPGLTIRGLSEIVEKELLKEKSRFEVEKPVLAISKSLDSPPEKSEDGKLMNQDRGEIAIK